MSLIRLLIAVSLTLALCTSAQKSFIKGLIVGSLFSRGRKYMEDHSGGSGGGGHSSEERKDSHFVPVYVVKECGEHNKHHQLVDELGDEHSFGHHFHEDIEEGDNNVY